MLSPNYRYRAPNPPPCFAGRKDERYWLQQLERQGPIAVIAGPAGIGKTALVLHHLSSMENLDSAHFISVRPGDPFESVLRNLLWALVGEGTEVDAPFLAREPEEAIAAAITMADAQDALIVIDDLDLANESEQTVELIIQVASFARRSRWFMTMKALPPLSELQGRACLLPGLSEVELLELGRALTPRTNAAHLQRAAAASGGSPLIFKQHLLAGDAALNSVRTRELSGLDEASIALLSRLALLRLALPSSVVATLTTGDSESLLSKLFERGLVVRDAEGYRAHDVVPGLCSGDDELEDVASMLAASREPRAWLEALRLVIQRGEIDTALRLLERSGQELLARGEAPRLWTVLNSSPDTRLRLWQIRCASELGNATALYAIGRPELENGDQRRDWARMLFLQGDPTQALQVLQTPLRHDEEAIELKARCLIALGRAAEACAILYDRNTHPALLAFAMAIAAPNEAAPQLPKKLSLPEMVDVVRAAFYRGELERTERLLEALFDLGGGANFSLLLWREVALLQTRMDLARGRLNAARARLKQLRPFVRGPTLLRPHWLLLDAELRMAMGRFEGVAENLEHARELAEEMDRLVLGPLESAQQVYQTLHGQGCETPSPGSLLPIALFELRSRILDHRRSLQKGSVESEEFASIAGKAKAVGLALDECEALVGSCDSALLSKVDHEAHAKVLLARAQDMGSDRFQAAALYFLGLRRPAMIEQAAASKDPRSSRRARARLGLEVTLDPLDEQLLKVAPSFAGRVTTLGPRDAFSSPAWGLWDEAQTVWLPDGREIDFSRRPLLYRLLTALFDAGGEAAKEHLISNVWEEREYHPLRHDQKLFVAIRTIRSMIEEHKGAPLFLLTTESGYSLKQPVRRVSLEPV